MEWSDFEQVFTDYVPVTTFLVTNALDSGTGSLRQAILNANASANNGQPDQIRFAIPGVGLHTISPLTPLPTITDPVVIDGTSQPGYTGTPVIELDGSLAGSGNGLSISSGDTTVRGLDIHSFTGELNALISMTGPAETSFSPITWVRRRTAPPITPWPARPAMASQFLAAATM